MNAIIITAAKLARRREERERLRRHKEAIRGSILDPLAHEDHPPSTPASPAPQKETLK